MARSAKRKTSGSDSDLPSKIRAKSQKKEVVVETNYASEEYWNHRYQDNTIAHEWYYTFEILEPLLLSTLVKKDLSTCKALEIGCGDRPVVDKFHRLGLSSKNLYGMDFSGVVIDMLQTKQKDLSHTDSPTAEEESPVHYSRADARKMPQYATNDFGLVVDKGTMDAMLSSSNSKAGLANAQKLVAEAVRVLALDGSFVLISHIEVDSEEFELLMDEVLLPVLEAKPMVNWCVKAHIVSSSGGDGGEGEDAGEGQASQYGTIYIITSHAKRQTRHAGTTKATVDFEVLQYTDSDDEEGEGDGEDEFVCCMPCGP